MEYETNMADADIEQLIESEPFATGTSRYAYNLKTDPDAVVKKSVLPRHLCNVLEWIIWRGAEKHDNLARVLGRCHCLSNTGQYLIMERLDDIVQDDHQMVPDLPEWCNDLKPSSFGKRGGLIKVRDYGSVDFEVLLNRTLVHPPAFAVNARVSARLKGAKGN